MVSFLLFSQVAFSLLSCVTVSDSLKSNSVTPWTVAQQAPLSMGFSRQESWSGLPFPSPGHLPYLKTDPCSW